MKSLRRHPSLSSKLDLPEICTLYVPNLAGTTPTGPSSAAGSMTAWSMVIIKIRLNILKYPVALDFVDIPDGSILIRPSVSSGLYSLTKSMRNETLAMNMPGFQRKEPVAIYAAAVHASCSSLRLEMRVRWAPLECQVSRPPAYNRIP